MYEFNKRNTQLSALKDRLANYNEPIFDAEPKDTLDILPFDDNNHLPAPPIQNNILEDNYLVNRVEFSKFDDRKLLLKQVQTSIENNTK